MSLRSFAVSGVVFLAACAGSPAPVPVLPSAGSAGAPAPAVAASTATLPAPKLLQTVEGISEYELANGLRVILFPDESQASVTVNVTYFVGSRHEGYGETGMAHLLEHMVFKGTPTHKDIWKLLQDHGARFNGSTWVDRTNYYETLPASDKNLEFALALEADRMVNSTIAPEELAKEFSVVRNEFESGENNPIGILEERMTSAAFLWHNYGKSTIGNKSDIEKVPATSLRRFYEKYYQPDNALLVVAGRFEPNAALALVSKLYAPIPRPSRTLEPTYTVEPVQDGERSVVLRRNGDVQAVGALYHGVPGAHADAVALDAIVQIQTAKPSGRLFKKLVETKKAARVWGNTYPFRDPGVVMFMAEVPTGKSLDDAEATLLQTIEGLAKAKITDEEVNRYKAQALKSWELAFTDSSRIAVGLSEYAAMGDWRLLFLHRDHIEKLTRADVERVAGTYFKRSSRTTGRFVPTKSPDRVPEVSIPDIATLVSGYKGREKVAAGEKFEATIPNIEHRTERTALKNGMKVALLPKQTRGNAVTAQITLRFASERDLKGKTTAVEFIPQMLMRGTTTRTYQQIKDELDRLKAQVSFGGAGPFGNVPNQVTATVRTTRDNLPAVLAIVADIVKNPSFPADQFTILRDETLTRLEESKNDPQALAFLTAFREASPWPKTDIRYVQTIDEQIAALKKVRQKDLKALHRKFYGASYGDIAIVGDFDSDAARSALEQHFGQWASKKRFERITSPYKSHESGQHEINTPDKKNAMIVAVHTLKLRDDHPDYAAMTMAGYILGGGGSSRLMNRLRQKDGLSYGAFGGVRASSQDDNGFVFAGAICAPSNLDKAMVAMLDEFQKFETTGVEQEELTRAIGAYLEAQKGSLSKDGAITSQLAEGLYLGRTLEFRQKLNERIAKLTTAEVNQAIKKYIGSAKLIRVVAGDLAERAK